VSTAVQPCDDWGLFKLAGFELVKSVASDTIRDTFRVDTERLRSTGRLLLVGWFYIIIDTASSTRNQ